MADDSVRIEKKIEQMKELFFGRSSEEKIQCLLNLSHTLAPFPEELKTASNRVAGCQSILYLSSLYENEKIYFNACADALISGGLAALMISIYSGEPPETIIRVPPNFLLDFGILSSLTPMRSNGLAHIYQRIKTDALKFLISTTKSIELNSASL